MIHHNHTNCIVAKVIKMWLDAVCCGISSGMQQVVDS